jgi:hypothetical protein
MRANSEPPSGPSRLPSRPPPPTPQASFRTREEADLALFRYIDGWYNPHRIQKALGWRSPDEYEADYHRNLKAATPAGLLTLAGRKRARALRHSPAVACGSPLSQPQLLHQAL